MLTPDWYKSRVSANGFGVDCMNVISACTVSLTGMEIFYFGNAIKYLWRYGAKGDGVSSTMESDAVKALHYLSMLEDYSGKENAELSYNPTVKNRVVGVMLDGRVLTELDLYGLFPVETFTQMCYYAGNVRFSKHN